ncbi:MAG: hypothetical protein KDE58_09855, partial [Caldilineaceae bacterium]|nr:hypothetical protein [Caldilineaceae bacterium]
LRGEADRQIPTPFWDVRTAGMDADHVTEYTLVNGLTQPALATYLEWMANCFTRFSAFKTDQAAGGEDTALDAALDMLLYTLDYLDATLGPLPADATAEVQQARSEQAVRMWQNIIAGTTRYNPLTDKAMVAQTLSSRYTVMEMWRYATGERAGNSELWGVSGFAERFVGEERNINQIEHMSISTFLQFVLAEPVTVLNAEEARELLNGHSSGNAMAYADMAVNRAIADEFVPTFVGDPRGTVEHLRCFFKGACASRTESME